MANLKKNITTKTEGLRN